MSRFRRKKQFDSKILLFAIMIIGLGFAALSATLGITGLTRIGHISFDVHFENIEIIDDSMIAEVPATISEDNPTQINFSLLLTTPGEYYEFETDIVNSGTLDAYLSSIELIGIDEDTSKYLSVDYKYTDGVGIARNDLLREGQRERINVRVEFLYDISLEDLPEEASVINLGINLVYTQDNGVGLKRGDTLYSLVINENEGIDNISSRYVTNSNGIDFTNWAYEENGMGLYLRAGTENDKYPIYYFRGGADTNEDGIEDELNNNVLFADKCWKIVRTTETGGTKLVYNGNPEKEYTSTEALMENDYNVISNNSYSFDSSSLQWQLNDKKDCLEIIQFSLKSEGDYILNYMDNYSSDSYIAIRVNGKQKKLIYLEESGTIYLGELSLSDIVEFDFLSQGDETVAFNVEKITNEADLICRNAPSEVSLEYKDITTLYEGGSLDFCVVTPIDEIMRVQFSSGAGLASVGYMYSSSVSDYKTFSKRMSSNTEYSSSISFLPMISGFSNNFYYSKTYNFDGGKYTLTDPVRFGAWHDNYTSLIDEGYYTCASTSANETCSTLYYIIGGDYWHGYSIPISNGDTLEKADLTVMFGSDYNVNDDGTYTLSGNIMTTRLSDWPRHYSRYENKYICSDYTKTTCNDIYYITDSYNYYFNYVKADLIYGNDVIYNKDEKTYTLKNTIISKWGDDISNHHYTCFSKDNTCKTVNYVYNNFADSAYYYELTDGKKINDLLNEIFANDNTRNQVDSNAKSYIDNWFKQTIDTTTSTNYLEDTIWCNDREISSHEGFNPNGGKINSYLYFASSSDARKNNPKTTCTNKYDRFTLKSTIPNSNANLNGNQMLDYPVGSLTIDEIRMAGFGDSSYLYNYSDGAIYYNYSLSPNFFGHNTGQMYYLIEYDDDYQPEWKGFSFLPAISLKHNVVVESGNGSFNDPYVIK